MIYTISIQSGDGLIHLQLIYNFKEIAGAVFIKINQLGPKTMELFFFKTKDNTWFPQLYQVIPQETLTKIVAFLNDHFKNDHFIFYETYHGQSTDSAIIRTMFNFRKDTVLNKLHNNIRNTPKE